MIRVPFLTHGLSWLDRNDRLEVMLDDSCAEKRFFASVSVNALRKKEKSLNSENRNKINVLQYRHVCITTVCFRTRTVGNFKLED